MAVDQKIIAAQNRVDAALTALTADVQVLKDNAGQSAQDVDTIAAKSNAQADAIESLDNSIKPPTA